MIMEHFKVDDMRCERFEGYHNSLELLAAIVVWAKDIAGSPWVIEAVNLDKDSDGYCCADVFWDGFLK